MSSPQPGHQPGHPGRMGRRSRLTTEQLREAAVEVLAVIDRDRAIERLLREGLAPQEVAERTGAEPRFVAHVGQQIQRGEPVFPQTPEELIYRRFLGQISSQEMMDRLRSWLWTVGRVRDYNGYGRSPRDYVDFLYRRLGLDGYLSDQEYDELRAATGPKPNKPPDAPAPRGKGRQPQ